MVQFNSLNLPFLSLQPETKALAMPDGSCFGTQDTDAHDHTSCVFEKLVRA